MPGQDVTGVLPLAHDRCSAGLPSPYRSILGALLDYVEENLDKDPECWITVVLPEILPARWWQNILHNQRALLLKGALLFKDRVVLTDVPFHLTR